MLNETRKNNDLSVLALKIRKNSFQEAFVGLTQDQAVNEAKRCQGCADKSCTAGCAFNVRIPEFIAEVSEGNFEKAYRIISRSNPLPSVCSRTCSSQPGCQSVCICPDGAPVAVAALERFVADYHNRQLRKETAAKKEKSTRHKIAVVGSGPSGLSCAGELAKKGYDVTVFEPRKTAGGALKYTVPSFTLSDKTLQLSIDALKTQGVKVKTDTPVSSVRVLSAIGFDAVYVASHNELPQYLNIRGETLKGVFSGEDFLQRVAVMQTYKNAPIKYGDRVVVVGGGDMAIDAARSARRLGGRVTVLYNGTPEDMTAGREAVRFALQEGVTFEFLAAPIEFGGNHDGAVTDVYCQRLRQEKSRKTGKTRLIPLYESEFEILADRVIVAVGMRHAFKQGDRQISYMDERGAYQGETGKETAPGCFYFNGSTTIIGAISAGKQAAKAIDQFLGKGAYRDVYLHVDADINTSAAVSGLS